MSAKQAMQMNSASMASASLIMALGLRLKRTKIENLDQLVLVAANSDRQHAVTLESLKRKLARNAKVGAKMEAVLLDAVTRLDMHCVGHLRFPSCRVVCCGPACAGPVRLEIPRRGAAGNRQLARFALAGDGDSVEPIAITVNGKADANSRLFAGCVVRFEHLRFPSLRC